MKPEAKISVDLDGTPYPLYIGRDVIQTLPQHLSSATRNKQTILIYDVFFEDTIIHTLRNLLEQAGFNVVLHAVQAGKANKNFNEALKIYSKLEELNFARDSTLIALGGGVIGDLSGFIASTWLRGMKLVHIPTTLLAMVDSSVGGKTAINFRSTINGIGSYYHPILNLVDLNLVESLSDRDYRSGLAEVIKCAIIHDRDFFDHLSLNKEKILSREASHVTDFIERTIRIKIHHVQGDVKEGGKRLLLNYGHTLGHAIEISTTDKYGQEQLRHGEGVSIGIMAVAHIASRHLGTEAKTKDDIGRIFKEYGLPVDVSSSLLGFNRDRLIRSCLDNVVKDKKRLDNNLRLILADSIGSAGVYNDVPFSLIEETFNLIIKE
jgi:3-dehydroquinate synthase